MGGPFAGRLGAIVQSSAFDAVNGVTRQYTPVHFTPNAPPGASAKAAAASAAYTALVAELPGAETAVRPELADTMTHLGPNPGGPAVQAGLAWGATVANDIVTWRNGDGINAVLPPYVPGTAPGDWQPTPPLFGPPALRQFAQMIPFAMTSPAQFLPAGPPASTSARYHRDLAEIQSARQRHQHHPDRLPDRDRDVLAKRRLPDRAVGSVADTLAVSQADDPDRSRPLPGPAGHRDRRRRDSGVECQEHLQLLATHQTTRN